MGTTKQPWTPQHVNQAKSALYRLAAEHAAAGHHVDAFSCVCAVGEQAATASAVGLRGVIIDELGLSTIDADRIVRTVCARAEGREVTDPPETFYRVRFDDGTYWPEESFDATSETAAEAARFTRKEDAENAALEEPGAVVVPVRVTRRRTVPAKKGG